MLSCAIILSEVFFVADSINSKNPMRPTKKVEEGNLMKRHLAQLLKKKVEKEKKSNTWFQLEKLW
jgi:hypothetical protein